jgi:hypothetical protein
MWKIENLYIAGHGFSGYQALGAREESLMILGRLVSSVLWWPEWRGRFFDVRHMRVRSSQEDVAGDLREATGLIEDSSFSISVSAPALLLSFALFISLERRDFPG